MVEPLNGAARIVEIRKNFEKLFDPLESYSTSNTSKTDKLLTLIFFTLSDTTHFLQLSRRARFLFSLKHVRINVKRCSSLLHYLPKEALKLLFINIHDFDAFEVEELKRIIDVRGWVKSDKIEVLLSTDPSL